MSLFLALRSRRTEWARKVYAPRLFCTRIPPRELPRNAWGWFRHLLGRRASRRVWAGRQAAASASGGARALNGAATSRPPPQDE
jgi:hypothetical protein